MADPSFESGRTPVGSGDSVRQLVDEARESIERSLAELMSQVDRDEISVSQRPLRVADDEIERVVDSRLAELRELLRREEAEAGDSLRSDLEARVASILDGERRRLQGELDERHRELAGRLEHRIFDIEERVRLAELHLERAGNLVDRGARVEERMRAALDAEERAATRIAAAERRIAELLDDGPGPAADAAPSQG